MVSRMDKARQRTADQAKMKDNRDPATTGGIKSPNERKTCAECNSFIVWIPNRGEYVCVRCGTVQLLRGGTDGDE